MTAAQAAGVEAAIDHVRASRQTHVEWLKFWDEFEAHQQDCQSNPCPWEAKNEETASIAGDADHHRKMIAGYDNVLIVLGQRGSAQTGWFADIDDEQDGTDVWQPCLETGTGHIPSFEVWFPSKQACEQWIAKNVIGVGWCVTPGEVVAGEILEDFLPLGSRQLGQRPGTAGL